MPRRNVDEDMDFDISGWRDDGAIVNLENLSHNCLSRMYDVALNPGEEALHNPASPVASQPSTVLGSPRSL